VERARTGDGPWGVEFMRIGSVEPGGCRVCQCGSDLLGSRAGHKVESTSLHPIAHARANFRKARSRSFICAAGCGDLAVLRCGSQGPDFPAVIPWSRRLRREKSVAIHEARGLLRTLLSAKDSRYRRVGVRPRTVVIPSKCCRPRTLSAQSPRALDDRCAPRFTAPYSQ